VAAIDVPDALRPLAATGRDVQTRAPDPGRDAPALFAATAGDAEMWTWMGYGPFADEAALSAWIERSAASLDPRWFTVVRRADGAAVGMAALMSWSPAHRRVELGHIWYARAARRTTVNTEVLLLAGREAFGVLGARRLEWKCDALNTRSMAAARRLGFTYEGTFRQHLVVKGRNRDTVWFSITDQEWPARRSALERWLYETPRDAAGRPTAPLESPSAVG
jgi:RimJ/RimL family protein N-acetyltransferase